jgi:dihydroorotase
MLDLIIKNGECYVNGALEKKDIGITNNKIVQIGDLKDKSKEIFDAKGLIVLPGCIDTQVHFREPGSTDTEDLNSGSKAAKTDVIPPIIAALLPELRSSVSVEPGSLK